MFTDFELLYAATARCSNCNAGLAYPHRPSEIHPRPSAWICSRVLKGEVPAREHTSLPFVFWKVREETSINNMSGQTTRPEGTVALTVGHACCPVATCRKRWKSEPYAAPGLSHHWQPGPCPDCGYAVGAHGSYSSTEGKPIDTRFEDVVFPKR